ncbi:ProQ/FINO family protein [Methylomagnum ishizawai]|uniref:ProQ/FINO family protein n=1 Tax=Methylomagnum ishizawai TaxID=1760988 RepID=A0A1Y6D4G1_9GAMM|nr:ProQ/FinO family protein [Methylomagnum ishizawai]SMF97839.1 ProQ/FINO family protein [Methylomagnum ishizawai]
MTQDMETPGPGTADTGKPTKPPKPKREERLLAELRALYPKAFASGPEAVMPLALYIHHKIKPPEGYTRAHLSAALRLYTTTPEYLAALAAGRPRVGLEGEPAGFVSEVHRKEAAATLADPGSRLPKKEKRRLFLAARLEHPTDAQGNPMPKIRFSAAQAKITLVLDPATFRAALDLDTVGIKTLSVTIEADGKYYDALLNPKSFRKAQAAFREAASPVVTISGNLKDGVVESAGIQVFDKGAKAAEPAPVPASAPQVRGTPASNDRDNGRPRLGLKPKAGG